MQKILNWSRRALLPVSASLLIGTFGCAASEPAPEPEREITVVGPSYEVQLKLKDACDAINAGDLQSAREHIAAGRAAGGTPYQRTKLDSLEHLVDGAEAMMHGDAAGARASWDQITDPHLRMEVDSKAGAFKFKTRLANQ